MSKKQQLSAFLGRIEDGRQKTGFRCEAGQVFKRDSFGVAPDSEPQKQRRQKHRQEHRQKNDDPDGNLGGVQSNQAENEDRKGGLRLHHGSDSDFLLVFGGFGFFEDRAADTAGSVDIAENIIYGRYGYSGVDTDDLHQGHENTHQGVGKAKAFQQASHGNADDDRDTDGTCDIDLDDNRGGMVEHIVEQVPDTAGVNYQHQKGKGD